MEVFKKEYAMQFCANAFERLHEIEISGKI